MNMGGGLTTENEGFLPLTEETQAGFFLVLG